MQFKLLFTFFLLPLLAVALPGGAPPVKTTVVPTTTTKLVPTTITVTATATATTISQCNTGSIQCCNSVQSSSSSAVSVLAGLLGIVLGPVTGLVGLTCSPLSVIGIGGNSCTAQPVCCTGNSFNGLIVLGCSPINL